MNTIHFDYEGKTARLVLQSLKKEKASASVRRATSKGDVSGQRIMNGIRAVDPASVSTDSLIAGDPELDVQLGGNVPDLDLLSPAYLNGSHEVVSQFEEWEIVYAPDGTEKEKRKRTLRKANVDDVYPVKVGKTMALEKALTGFVFRGVYQLVHEDGIGYDFLYSIADRLSKAGEVALLGAGPKGNLPLIFKEKGSPYRAFLYGETGTGDDAGKYRLLILLSNQELKLP
jgi:hypothetical protein